MAQAKPKQATDGSASLRGLDEVRVKKTELLKRVQENRDEHRKIFEEALEGWKKKVTKDLEDAVEDAKAGRDYRFRFNNPKPVDHTDDYDSVIELLKMSQDTEFVLARLDFECFVMDKWGWQRDFLTLSSAYGSTSADPKADALNYRD
jgi:hypothetical protein